MKVKELINILKKYSEDMLVVYPNDSDDGLRYFTFDEANVKNLIEEGYWMECCREPTNKDINKKNEIIKGLVIS